MRGLYLNCDGENIPASIELAEKYSEKYIFPETIGVGMVIYSAAEWPQTPVFFYNDHTFVVSGWFIFKESEII
jgi:hypothetical protein